MMSGYSGNGWIPCSSKGTGNPGNMSRGRGWNPLTKRFFCIWAVSLSSFLHFVFSPLWGFKHREPFFCSIPLPSYVSFSFLSLSLSLAHFLVSFPSSIFLFSPLLSSSFSTEQKVFSHFWSFQLPRCSAFSVNISAFVLLLRRISLSTGVIQFQISRKWENVRSLFFFNIRGSDKKKIWIRLFKKEINLIYFQTDLRVRNIFRKKTDALSKEIFTHIS